MSTHETAPAPSTSTAPVDLDDSAPAAQRGLAALPRPVLITGGGALLLLLAMLLPWFRLDVPAVGGSRTGLQCSGLTVALALLAAAEPSASHLPGGRTPPRRSSDDPAGT